MILKKPYAFLIKYFKTIHIVLLVLMSYLLYRTNIILNFFQEYISSNQLTISKDFTGKLFNIYMFVIPFIIIVVLIILLAVMYYKKKPVLFYIYNILMMIAILIFYNIGYNAAGTLEMQVIETRTLRLLRDFFMLLILFQGISTILTFIRATGFDYKKFDFGHDLEELDITEADSEEFEVDVDIETNVLKREVNRKLRFSKYIYLENKFIINTIFLIIFSIVCFIMYMNLTIYNKFYNQNELFMGTEFTMEVSNSYLTNQDYKGNQITDNYLLVIELNIKANYATVLTLNTAKAELKVGNHTYHHKDNYSSSLIDLGQVYNGLVIDMKNFQKELLVYEIPKSDINEKMTFNYIDNIEFGTKGLNPKYVKVKINPYNLDSKEKLERTNAGEVKTLNTNVLKETNIYITEFEMQKKFKIDYKYCDKNDCYDSHEYLVPLLNTNYDKALFKISGIANIDQKIGNNKINNLYNIINYFGKIRYEIDGRTKYLFNLKRILPNKTNPQDIYYFEIPIEIFNADHISFIVDVRNLTYEYNIK